MDKGKRQGACAEGVRGLSAEVERGWDVAGRGSDSNETVDIMGWRGSDSNETVDIMGWRGSDSNETVDIMGCGGEGVRQQ